MHTLLGNNIVHVKQQNQQAILLTLLREGALSRVQLAQRLALSTTTLTNLTAELLENGLLRVVDKSEPHQQRAVGRPPTLLTLQKNARLAVGVHLEIGGGRVALINLKGEWLQSETFTFHLSSQPEQVLQLVADRVRDMVQKTAVSPHTIVGLGVGSSGHIDVQTGICHHAPSLGWQNVPIATILAEATQLPTIVDNNVRVMALAEAYFGQGRDVDSLAFVFGRSGIGAGLIVNRQLWRGAGAGAGEFGHMVIVPELGELCRCGQRGCLETVAAQSALVRQLAALPHVAAQLNFAQDDAALLADMLQLARAGQPETVRLLERVALFLGLGLVNLINLLQPQRIVLGGMYAQAADFLLPKLTSIIRERTFGTLGQQVTLDVATFGEETGVVGAGALALEKQFYLAESALG